MADREGVQPEGEGEGASAAGGRAASSLTPHHESQSTAADGPQLGRRDNSYSTRSSAYQPDPDF